MRNTNAQLQYDSGATEERLIAAGVSNAVLNGELHVLDLLMKEDIAPGPSGSTTQRFLLGQVLALHGYPHGDREYQIAVRVRRTKDDVDSLGEYLGDLFMWIRIEVEPLPPEFRARQPAAFAEHLPPGTNRVRVDVIGRDTDLTFDEIEEHLFPVPAVVLDASDSEEAGGPVHEVATSSELPYINKIVGPSPQRAEPERGERGTGTLRMDVRFTRLSLQTWRDICTLEEAAFEAAMSRISAEMREMATAEFGNLSDHIPQGLLVSTVVDQCDWTANPTLTITGSDGVETPIAEVLDFSGENPSDAPVRERFLTFTVWDVIRDVVEVILIVARLVEEESGIEVPETGSSADHLPEPPGPAPPAIRAVHAKSTLPSHEADSLSDSSHSSVLTVIPAQQCYPAHLPSGVARRFAAQLPGEDNPLSSEKEIHHARAVSESLYTDNLEVLLGDLEKHGKQLETTHTARPSEVKQHLDRWVDAMKSELDGHLDIGSLTKHVGDDAKTLMSTPGAEVLPALAVYTAKPPKIGSSKAYRRKCRAVACGNHTHVTSEENTYSAGAQAEAVRLALAMASQESWAAFVTDISQAFLRAPLPNLDRLILLRPPSHFIQAGICQPSEVWQAHRAVYGLREAPKWWADHRDQILRGSSWTGEGETMHLEQLEGSVWLLKNSEGERKGVVVVYVDDCLVLSSQEHAQGFHGFLNEVWETSPLECCQHPGEMVQFLGMTICKTEKGFSLGQQPYLQDLLSKYNVEISSPQTVPRDWVKEEPIQREYETCELRQAQSICGELLWLSQRTRPDIAHTVSLLAAWTTKDPALVFKMGLRVLQYLHGTLEHRLVLEAEPGAPMLECFTDASFAPYGSRSYSGVAIRFQGCLVLWRATKQGLMTLSSSESELVAATEGIVLALGVREMLQQMAGLRLPIKLLVDNTSALQLIQGKGANRTRHLRIRSNFVKEKVDEMEVILQHVAGVFQHADLFTKILPGPRLKYLRVLVGLQSPAKDECDNTEAETGERLPQVAAARTEVSCGEAIQRWLMVLVAGVQVYAAQGQEQEDPGRLEVKPPYELMILTALVVLSVLAVWEGGRSIVGCCVSRKSSKDTPRIRAVSKAKKGKSVEERVQEAIQKELKEGLRSRCSTAKEQSVAQSSSFPPPNISPPRPPAVEPVPPPPVNTYKGRSSSSSQTMHPPATQVQCQGTQTEVPYPAQATGVAIHQVMTTMQRGGVVHLYDDCPTLGVPAYRQSRAFCQRCLNRGGYL